MSLTEEVRMKGERALSRYSDLFERLKVSPEIEVDGKIAATHEAVFQKTDCTTCANCCKTAGPLLIQEDIIRISESLGIAGGAFIEKYLEMDEDGDFIFRKSPCPFLGSDDLCTIYEIRPQACAEYPHTNRKSFAHLKDVTLANALICPAVQDILDELDKVF